MTTETEQHPTWGEEPPPQAAAAGTGWNGRKSLAAVAIALGIAAVGGGVIYAASNSDAAQGMGGPGGYGRGNGGLVMMGGPFGGTQHGEFQNGEVTEVSDSSITVKSTDGFSETYQLDGDTQVNGGQGDLDDIVKGDVVTVIADRTADGQATADSIMKGNMMRGGPPQKQGNGQPPAKQDQQGGPTDQQGTPPTR
ncbi:hypothetical protein ADK67_17225 [Saccharothrix sp. NRRL B-16348]|uniref:DUF5666 domain-containing protein n=1 Tax=Saccharothrix sp. NRRL B-16348 TaxID=1415542 RepID=UPI0006C2C4E1|nr:DUF5666 domain-containing protein [Saccharothrix sp. NRRL B-16348]KOX24813.1 hypothetical protein ADK67_17225 [Saccharothrix sp. NRRL B-16348]